MFITIVISSFKNPPALDFYQKEAAIIPDILVIQELNNIQVQINEKYYPSIELHASTQMAIHNLEGVPF